MSIEKEPKRLQCYRVYMLSLFLSLGFPYRMITSEQWNESGLYVYILFNDKIFKTVSSISNKMWILISKICLSGWIAERTYSRNLVLDSVWSDSSTISQSGFSLSELLSFGLSRFCLSLNIPERKLKNFATIQVLFESLHTYTWAPLLWNFSKSQSNKISAESPLAER